MKCSCKEDYHEGGQQDKSVTLPESNNRNSSTTVNVDDVNTFSSACTDGASSIGAAVALSTINSATAFLEENGVQRRHNFLEFADDASVISEPVGVAATGNSTATSDDDAHAIPLSTSSATHVIQRGRLYTVSINGAVPLAKETIMLLLKSTFWLKSFVVFLAH